MAFAYMLGHTFPIYNVSILIVATVFLLIKSLFNRSSGAPLTLSRIIVGLGSLALLVCGGIMIFGPGIVARISTHVVLLGAIGLYTVITSKNGAKILFFSYSIIVLLCLIGAGYVFTGTSNPASNVNKLTCYTYYGTPSEDYCSDQRLQNVMVAATIAASVIVGIVAAFIPTMVIHNDSDSSYFSIA